MALSAFGNKAIKPTKEITAEVLGESFIFWDKIKKHIAATYKKVSEDWKMYTKDAGWTLVVKSDKRTLLYLIPQQGAFKANFVYGGKTVAATENEGLPVSVLTLIREAQQYVEGRSFMIDIKTAEDAETAIRLIKIKYEN